MVYLQTKNPFEMKMLLNFMTIGKIFSIIWYNLWPFGIVYGHLVNFSRFGMFGSRKIWQAWLLGTAHQKLVSTRNFSGLRKKIAEKKVNCIHPLL
jgi:hypothetical protein